MSQPVGPEYGLEPTRDVTGVLPPISSEDLVSGEDYRDGTEFGGVGGLIQPPPHVPDASERRMMLMHIDPTDDGTRADSVLAPELDGNF